MAGDEDGNQAKPDFSRIFRFLMAIQFLGRAIPFGLNIFLVRHLKLEDFAAIFPMKIQLFLSLIFAVSRDGIRRACMRADIQCSGPKQEENAARLLKIAWISFPLGLACTLVAFTFCLQDQHHQAFLIHGLACMLELLAEPVYILAQNMLLLEVRLVVETVATAVRCVTIGFLFDRYTDSGKGNAIALSQASYGATLVIGYWGYFLLIRNFKCTHLVPFRMRNAMNRDKELSSLCGLFIFQSIGMFWLQEGEKKIVMWFYTTDKIQAVYGLVEKLGSLVVRLVFFPFEESSYSMFAKLASGTLPQRKVKLEHSLGEALKIIMLIGFVVFAFGQGYSYSLLRLLYGGRLTDHEEAPTMLRCYCLYVIILAINGTLEAFLHAVADQRELQLRLYIFLPICSIFNIVLNVLLIPSIGAVGSVIANSIIMIMRIIYSAVFIKHYFQENSAFAFRQCLPSGWQLLLLSGPVTLISEKVFLDRENFLLTLPFHVSVGLICLAISSTVIYRQEKHFIRKIFPFVERIDHGKGD